jgi:replicative DNA helicase
MSKTIKTAELERCLLSVFFKDPGWLGEIGEHIKYDFFAFIPNQKIFSAIKTLYNETKTLDEHLLISRLNLMGLTSIEGLDVADYISAIAHMSINLDSKIAYLDELTKFYWARQTYKKLLQAQKYIESSLEQPELTFKDILSGTEKIITDAVTIEAVNGDDDLFVDIYGDIETIIAEQVNQKDNMGISSPFPIFNGRYGQFLVGELYVFGAPAKVGKSTLLSAIVDHAIKTGGGKVRVLILDTELQSNRVACRDIAAESGVNEYFYRTGKFTEDSAKIKLAQEAFERMKQYKGMVYHRYVPNKTIQQVESIARRWHNKFVDIDNGEIGLICYDYLKLISTSRSSSDGPGSYDLKEWELIGQIANSLKMLASDLPNTTVITATQLNEGGGVAQSARIRWFCTALHFLIRKTSEEVGMFGKEFGTHKLVCQDTRNLGEFGDEAGDIPVAHGRDVIWQPNYINLSFDSFRVTECGVLADAVRAMESRSPGQLTPRVTASEKNKSTYQKYSK